LDAGDVVSIVSTISINKALVKLDISNSDLCAEGGIMLAAVLHGNTMMTELNIANNHLCIKADRSAGYDTSCVVAIADSIKNMGALTSLNLSSNKLEAEGAMIVAEAIKVTMRLPPVRPMAELLLFAAIHRITGR
jgi:hypothetical protein